MLNFTVKTRCNECTVRFCHGLPLPLACEGCWGLQRATLCVCGECLRIFDLARESDAAEWHYGHDCEA